MNRLRQDNHGYALITALIVTVVAAALVIGFITSVNTEQKIARNDTDYSSAFYAAEAGLEKLNSDLSKLFAATLYPSQGDIASIMTPVRQPIISAIKYQNYSVFGGHSTKLDGALNNSATTVTVDDTTGWPTAGFFMVDAEEFAYTGLTGTEFTGVSRNQNGSLAAAHSDRANVTRSRTLTLSEGDYSGLTAQIVPFTLDVTAQSLAGTEAKLTREVQAALIPVFQFGMFSDSDLSFFAGPDFTFNGRIHTNGNLFLTQFPNATLTLTDKVTAFKEIIRKVMANSYPGFTGTVNLKSGTSTSRNMADTEGSYDTAVGPLPPSAYPSAAHWAGWTNLSLTTYNGYLKNGLTGARNLKLPFVSGNYGNIELIRRPPANEIVDSLMGQSRLANQASLRVYISDASSNIPGGGHLLRNPLTGYTGTPFAEARANDPDFVTAAGADETTNAPLIDGYILIEYKKSDNTWVDATLEILGLGISTDDPHAILRFQKPRWDQLGSNAGDYIPLNMFDTQEGRFRNASDSLSTTTRVRKLGIMNVVELNVSKLREWFEGTVGASGLNAVNNSGYIFYFSDRRGNRDASGAETAELGFEDFVNPTDNEGDPSGALNPGEDLNGNGTLETYGANLPYSPYTASTDLYTTGVFNPTGQRAFYLGAALNNSSTSINVLSTTGLAVGYYRIENEIVNCTAVSSNPITCARGEFGTTAVAHAPGVGSPLLIQKGLSLTKEMTGNTADTTFSVASLTGVTTGYYRIDDEIVNCININVAASSIACVRAQLGTAAATHFPVEAIDLTASVTSTDTDFPVSSETKVKTPGYYRIDNEIVLCKTKAVGLLTCERGKMATAAAAHTPASTTTTAALTSGATSITVSSGAAFPSSGRSWYRIGTGVTAEIVNCTRSGNTLTCLRGQLQTAGGPHANSSPIRLLNVLPVNLSTSERASKNRVHYFRHALRLVNGTSPNLPKPGFTVASENIVYVVGNYNANGTANFADTHSHAAVMGDVVTLLSNSYANGGDERSFMYPHDRTQRLGHTTWYRMAIASGKGINFPKPGAEPDIYFGTDGGAHNFLRYLEDWNTPVQTSNYRGSIVSLYYMVQAVGPFKCCTSVYSPPIRAYGFDLEFLVPSQLPPGTPRFRDINNLSFRQTISAY